MSFHVGCHITEVMDPVQEAPIPMRLLYPTRQAETIEHFGPYEMAVAMNAPVAGEHLALVVFSHGGGGSSLTYRGLASHLACAGFVVALLEHSGNNRADNRLEGTVANLVNRPRHIQLAIDAAFANAMVGPRLRSRKVTLIGHSMGGYTALAIAGGRPMASPHEVGSGGQALPISVVPDPRIGALVLLAPACGWFGYPGALADVDIPILLMAAEKDELAVHLNVDLVKRGVRDPGKVNARVIPNAGHHAFQSPFPPSMVSPSFAPSQDPQGFDRAAFQTELQAEVLSFLHKIQ